MPKKTPSLSMQASVEVNAPLVITGKDFPKKTSVFIVVTQIAPKFDSLFPSVLVKTDNDGSLEATTVLTETGTFELSACIHTRKKGGRYDCNSVVPKVVEAG
jgi:hypothetical protein